VAFGESAVAGAVASILTTTGASPKVVILVCGCVKMNLDIRARGRYMRAG
jgi:hypothetical protein